MELTRHQRIGRQWAARVLAEDPDYFKRMGSLGGKATSGPDYQKGGIKAAGFAADPERARVLAAKGGRNSKPYTKNPRPET